MRASSLPALLPVLLLAIAGAAPGESPDAGVSLALAQARAKAISDVRYGLSLALKEHASRLTGHETIQFNLSGRFDLSANNGPLAIDFRDLTAAGAVANGQIGNVLVNGAAVTPEQVNGHILIAPAWLHAGANRIDLTFESAIAQANRAVTRITDPIDSSEYLYTLFVPMDASLAFPCFDQPDLKARFTLEATAPSGWTVISNTRETGPGSGVFRFGETKPISTYLFAFAAGPFEQLPAPAAEVSAVPMRLFVRKSMLARAREEWPEVARYTRQGMNEMAAFFAQPFPFPKYDQVLLPGFPYGGMEHAGATFLREDAVLFRAAPNATDHHRRAETVLHELAHQWFGDFVTMRWFDDLWLKEGFAQFMAFHTLAAMEPPDEVWKRFYESLKPVAYGIDSTPGTTPIYQRVRNLADAKSAYGPIVYQKAPSLLRVLNFQLGETAFREGVRAFLRQHAYANATWMDLIQAFSTASKQNLAPWAEAWVRQRGMPVVTVQWECSGQRIAGLRVAQQDSLHDGHLWPVSTELFLGAGRSVPVTFSSAEAAVPAAIGRACPDYVFANGGDHGYGRFLLDSKSLAFINGHAGGGVLDVADPLERALHWGALWDSVREAETDPREYVELAIRRLGKEEDLDITQSLLGRTATALRRYITAPVSPAFEALLMDRMKNAASRDFRIAYFRAFTGAASTPAAIGELQSLLAGRSSIPEVPLQQRDRWNIVAALVRQGVPDAEQVVRAEAARDPSEDGKRSAYAALASVATAENKRRYFEEYLKDGAAPEDFVTASLGGFNAWNQEALTLGYVGPALEALPLVKRQRKIFFVNGWLSSFVASHTSPQAQKDVETFLAQKDLDADLRLKVLEVKDELDRTIRIRNRWK
jgi:aminopeptidase N